MFIGSNLSFQYKEEIRTHPPHGRYSSDYPLLVRVGRLELPASCSQTCVGTFRRHSIALFGPFRRSGNSSLTLFRPACFKETFRLLGFAWDWILCIKRCSVRFEGAMTAQSPQSRGAGNAPHKQRNKPRRDMPLLGSPKMCVQLQKLAHKMCRKENNSLIFCDFD